MIKKGFEKLGESNRVCIIITKKTILNAFRGSMFEKITMVAEFFANIKNRFVKSEKKNSNRYTIISLISIRYMGKGKKKKNDKVYVNATSQEKKKLTDLKSTHCFFLWS